MSFTFPDPLPGSTEELNALREDALNAFNDLYENNDSPSKEDLEGLESIVEGVNAIDNALADLTGREERAAAAAELASKLTPVKNDDIVEASKESEEEAPATTSAEETESANSPAKEETEQLAASATAEKRTTAFSKAASGHLPEVPATEYGWQLTTSAKNFETGIVDSLRVAREFNDLAHGRAARITSVDGRSETTLATLNRQVPDEFSIGDQSEALEVLSRVTDEARLEGGSLVAAGGWCSPSETLYDFLPTETPGDLLSLPEVSIRRGGVKFPVEPDFSKVYKEIGFHQTEAQAQAGTEKTCFEIPCADFEELRLEVEGVCITSGILQDKAWPELTKKYVDEALRLHAHKINARRISKIVEGSTNVGTLRGGFGTAGAVLSGLELQVADMRAKHRLPSNRTVEGMAPVWLINVIRADLAYRQGVLPEQISNEQIRAHFALIGANIQFVGDWQNDVIGKGATGWPETVEVVLWTAGTWFSALEPVISLGVVYDSTMLKQNRRIQMFTEDGVAVGKRGLESRKVTIPIKVDGMVGLRGPVAAATTSEETTSD